MTAQRDQDIAVAYRELGAMQQKLRDDMTQLGERIADQMTRDLGEYNQRLRQDVSNAMRALQMAALDSREAAIRGEARDAEIVGALGALGARMDIVERQVTAALIIASIGGFVIVALLIALLIVVLSR